MLAPVPLHSSRAPRSSSSGPRIMMCTAFFMALCIVVELYFELSGADLNAYAIAPISVIYQHQYYRLVVSSVVHSGIVHIGMNMMSFFQLGAFCEPIFGTFGFFFLILSSILVSNVLYTGFCWVMTFYVMHDVTWLRYSSVGFSGVLFTLAVIHSYLSGAATRNVFGFQVPTRIYPWVLLVVLQILMPEVSFVGHLMGLIVGFFHMYGLARFLLPSATMLRALDSWPPLACITSRPEFVPCPNNTDFTPGGGMRNLCLHTVSFVRATVMFFITLVQGLFGIATAPNRPGGQGGATVGGGRRGGGGLYCGIDG